QDVEPGVVQQQNRFECKGKYFFYRGWHHFRRPGQPPYRCCGIFSANTVQQRSRADNVADSAEFDDKYLFVLRCIEVTAVSVNAVLLVRSTRDITAKKFTVGMQKYRGAGHN